MTVPFWSPRAPSNPPQIQTLGGRVQCPPGQDPVSVIDKSTGERRTVCRPRGGPGAKPLEEVVTPRQEDECAYFAVTRQPTRVSTGPGKVQRRPSGMSAIDWLTWVAYWRCYPFLPTSFPEARPGKPLAGDARRGQQAWLRMRTRVDNSAKRLGVLWHGPRALPPSERPDVDIPSIPFPSGPPKPAQPGQQPKPILFPARLAGLQKVETRKHLGYTYVIYMGTDPIDIVKAVGGTAWFALYPIGVALMEAFGEEYGPWTYRIYVSPVNEMPVYEGSAWTPAQALQRARARIAAVTHTF